LWRFDDLWIVLSEGPSFDDYLSGSGQYVSGTTAADFGLLPGPLSGWSIGW
jgi:hypothetical protein